MPETRARAALAAANNADLYGAIFDAHGLAYDRTDACFVARDRPPPYYSDVTLLDPDGEKVARRELAAMAVSGGRRLSIKDGFCALDLSDMGYAEMFSASWIWRAAPSGPMPEGWRAVSTEEELGQWEERWGRSSPAPIRMFPPGMLARRDVRFLAQYDAGRIVAGCLANLSRECAGLSNIFADQPGADVFDQAARAIGAVLPGVPVTGYEHGIDLEDARAAGFEDIGRLRVLIRPD